MPERASSGVQGLRAMFEQGSTDTSPPSRGRSPAVSVTSEGSRPISKVRTSFISVERSGQQGNPVQHRMSTGEGSMGADGTDEHRSVLNDTIADSAKKNASVDPSTSHNPDSSPGEHKNIAEDGAHSIHQDDQNDAADVLKNPDLPPANPDKPITATEEEAANILPADPKDETAVTGGTALKDNEQDLGSVLKGHPFEERPSQLGDAPKATNVSTLGNPSATTQKVKSKTPLKVNGHVENPIGAGRSAPAKSKAQPSRGGPALTGTKGPAASSPKTSGVASANKAGKSPRSPQTSKLTNGLGKKPASKPSSPRAAIAPKDRTASTKKDSKEPASAATRSSLPSKTPLLTPSNPRQPSSTAPKTVTQKTAQPTASKPRPKSPTRPARLPSSATAPTAASAAKAPPERPASRMSQIAASKTPRVSRPATTSTSGPVVNAKSTRSSLPAQPNAKPKPKPRTSTASTASTKPTKGDFLARMMRPTESTAKKVHDKVEVKSPPRKPAASKRKSGENRPVTGHQEEQHASREGKHEGEPVERTVSDDPTESAVVGSGTGMVNGADTGEGEQLAQ